MNQNKQQQNILNKNKNYQCKCGKSYDRNSSLFNHVKIQHQNNKEYFLFSQSKVGRPQGLKDASPRCPRGKAIEKRPIKEIQCKCGDILKGEGAFYNHVNGKHKGDSFYKQERKQQGRKRIQFQKYENSDTKTQFINNNTIESQSEIVKSTLITSSEEFESITDQKFDEENTLSSTYFEELDMYKSFSMIQDDRFTYIQNNKILNEDFDFLNTYEQSCHYEELYNYQYYDSYQSLQFSSQVQEEKNFSQYSY